MAGWEAKEVFGRGGGSNRLWVGEITDWAVGKALESLSEVPEKSKFFTVSEGNILSFLLQ